MLRVVVLWPSYRDSATVCSVQDDLSSNGIAQNGHLLDCPSDQVPPCVTHVAVGFFSVSHLPSCLAAEGRQVSAFRVLFTVSACMFNREGHLRMYKQAKSTMQAPHKDIYLRPQKSIY